MKIKFISRPAQDKSDYCGLRIWEKPKELQRYAIGADVAEGVGQDASCAQVINVNTGILVANYWDNQIDTDNYAALLFKLGTFYNRAHLCVEQNNHGNAVISHLSGAIGGLCYPNLYRRYVFDEYIQKKTKKIGFHTTRDTRPRIIENLKAALRDGDLQVHDPHTIIELNTFVKDNLTGKIASRGKNKDDRVMSLALAWEQARIIKETIKDSYESVKEIKYDSTTGFPLF